MPYMLKLHAQRLPSCSWSQGIDRVGSTLPELRHLELSTLYHDGSGQDPHLYQHLSRLTALTHLSVADLTHDTYGDAVAVQHLVQAVAFMPNLEQLHLPQLRFDAACDASKLLPSFDNLPDASAVQGLTDELQTFLRVVNRAWLHEAEEKLALVHQHIQAYTDCLRQRLQHLSTVTIPRLQLQLQDPANPVLGHPPSLKHLSCCWSRDHACGIVSDAAAEQLESLNLTLVQYQAHQAWCDAIPKYPWCRLPPGHDDGDYYSNYIHIILRTHMTASSIQVHIRLGLRLVKMTSITVTFWMLQGNLLPLASWRRPGSSQRAS